MNTNLKLDMVSCDKIHKVNKALQYDGGKTVIKTYRLLTKPFLDKMNITKGFHVADAICKEDIEQEKLKLSDKDFKEVEFPIYRLYFKEGETHPFRVRKKTTRGYFTHIKYDSAKYYMQKLCFIEYTVEQPDKDSKWRKKDRSCYDRRYREKKLNKNLKKGDF